MTAAASGRITAAGGGRHRLLAVALAVSLVLNLCFIAGALWTRYQAPPRPAERIQAIAGELGLDDQQRASFDKYFHNMQVRFQAMRTELAPIVTNAWAEMAKSQPDTAKIDQEFDKVAARRQALSHAARTDTLAFLATLSPAQRAKFFNLLREHHALWIVR